MGNQDNALERNVQNLLTPQSKHRVADRKTVSGYLDGSLPGPSQCTPNPHWALVLVSLSPALTLQGNDYHPSMEKLLLVPSSDSILLALDLDLFLTKAITRAIRALLGPNPPLKPLGTCRLKKFTST